jgi:hypothetical protein
MVAMRGIAQHARILTAFMAFRSAWHVPLNDCMVRWESAVSFCAEICPANLLMLVLASICKVYRCHALKRLYRGRTVRASTKLIGTRIVTYFECEHMMMTEAGTPPMMPAWALHVIGMTPDLPHKHYRTLI